MMQRTACIDETGDYRYKLSRIWNSDEPMVMFIMLNPSTADANVDDPTIRRCIGFAKSWGYGGLWVGNLFALRSPDPEDLLLADEPVGSQNNAALNSMADRSDLVVAAWSAFAAKFPAREAQVREMFGPRLYCLATTKGGHPRHPLYLKGDLTPIVYRA